MIRTASAACKLFLCTSPDDNCIVQFLSVSGDAAHSANVRKFDGDYFSVKVVELIYLTDIDQEAAKTMWLLQTGEELL